MTALIAGWWLFFWTAVGLCIGSFLNVVVYRLPRNRSLRSPLWSACPNCKKRIHFIDNIPVLSFLLLRGRCRVCDIPIATRYPVVEISMALVVLLILDALFIGQVRAGITASPFGLTDRLSNDWPIFLAHVILFAALMAMSAIDLEHYWVDVRFTNLVTACGFVLHALWTPRHSAAWIRPLDSTAIVCLFTVVGLGFTWLVFVCRPHMDPEDFGEEAEPLPIGPDAEPPVAHLPPPLTPPSRVAAWVAGTLLVGLLVLLFLDETSSNAFRHTGRALVPLAFLAVLIFSESIVPRPSDQAIVEAIYEERYGARRMALSELTILAPAIVFGILGFLLMRGGGELPIRLGNALHASVPAAPGSMFFGWSPWYGLATAATGYVVAGAIGWAVRIVFTLLFGKEAFGAGDIHMMAAAGCVAGWPVVLLGFMLTCALALLGWVATLPFKRTRALPLGPWLSISFLAVTVFYEPILKIPLIARATDAAKMIFLDGAEPRRLPRP